METKKIRLRIRKPLSDCTNTISKPSRSSSILKPPKPILSSAIKKLLATDNTHHHSPPNSINHSETSDAGSVRMRLAASNTEIHKSSGRQSSYSGRRHTRLKRKAIGKDIGMPLICSTSTVLNDGGMMKKPGSDLRTKRQLSNEDDFNKNLDEDFIKQQRLYFAEIDAFELLEEEVGSDEELG